MRICVVEIVAELEPNQCGVGTKVEWMQWYTVSRS